MELIFINLFSIFDPHTSIYFSFNWLSILIPLLFMPKILFFKNSKYFQLNFIVLNFLHNEIFNLFKNQNKINIYIFINIFYLFFIINFIRLIPYIFTSSRHLTITLPISLSLWLRIILYRWINKTNLIFTHLVPLNTPPVLIPFIVLIESIRNIIRPITLSVRLSANIIAGHLLLCLLGSTGNSLNLLLIIFLIITQILLFRLEIAVSIIQAYVFSILRALYSNEIYEFT